ncbi:MAG: hypothetical protein M1308_13620 [Actinobacteria bacterium]|nr:hypothetical protein [Actinomycetota bacterium]
MKTADVLFKDIEKLGYPKILVQTVTLTLQITPDLVQWGENKHWIEFHKSGEKVASLLVLNNYFYRIPRPSNLMVECEKCYQIANEETGELFGYLYWPKVKSVD